MAKRLLMGNEAIALGAIPVSYTHLDVYKRQLLYRALVAWGVY